MFNNLKRNQPRKLIWQDLQLEPTGSNDQLKLAAQFKWQGSYGAFTVSHSNLDEVVAYVKRQKEHHANQQLWPDYEESFEELDPSQKNAD